MHDCYFRSHTFLIIIHSVIYWWYWRYSYAPVLILCAAKPAVFRRRSAVTRVRSSWSHSGGNSWSRGHKCRSRGANGSQKFAEGFRWKMVTNVNVGLISIFIYRKDKVRKTQTCIVYGVSQPHHACKDTQQWKEGGGFILYTVIPQFKELI